MTIEMLTETARSWPLTTSLPSQPNLTRLSDWTLGPLESAQPMTYSVFSSDSEPDLPAWFGEAVSDAVRLRESLPDNWDTYGAKRLSYATIEWAFGLLLDFASKAPKPNVIPLPSGGIAFAWATPRGLLEVEVLAPGRGGFVFEDRTAGDAPVDSNALDVAVLRSAATHV